MVDQNAKPLYHASPNISPDETVITPHKNAIVTGKEYGNFIFAGENLDAAYVYAFKLADSSRKQRDIAGNEESFPYMCNCTPLGDDNVEVGVLCERANFLEQIKHAHPAIYEVPRASFEPVFLKNGHPCGEYRTTASIPIRDCKVTRLHSIEDAMRRGCQFFFLADGISKEEWFRRTEEFKKNSANIEGRQESNARLEFYREMAEQGIIANENVLRNINPINLETGKIEWTTKKEQDSQQLSATNTPPDKAKTDTSDKTNKKKSIFSRVAVIAIGAVGVIAAAFAADKFLNEGKIAKTAKNWFGR